MSHHSAWDGAIFFVDHTSATSRQCIVGALTMRRRWLDNASTMARQCIVAKWAMLRWGLVDGPMAEGDVVMVVEWGGDEG